MGDSTEGIREFILNSGGSNLVKGPVAIAVEESKNGAGGTGVA